MKTVFSFVFCATALILSAQNGDDPRKSYDPTLYPFYHGVASGDPLTDRVILWTRITDATLTDSVEINWRVATDTTMQNVVLSGSGYAKEAADWTFKSDAIGLQADTWYYYDFNALNHYSVRGRTKTAPAGANDSVRIAVVSCSNYEEGYFEAYKYMKERNDFDAVLHLGDYIYEYATSGNSIGREEVEPATEIITLDDYRLRYSHYRLDEDLRKVHQQYPFITVWDDHESANNSWEGGAENHNTGEGNWSDRKNYSGQAYHEWLPIRSPQPGTYSIYRKFQYGNLIDLYMLDTRIEGRSEQGGNANDPTRSILGSTQFNWLTNELSNSTAKWRIMGQQVMMAPLEVFGAALNDDQWDGYNYEREQLYDHIQNNNIDNIVVLTGDIHTSWVNDLARDNYDENNCTGSVGIEYVVTSVTSQGGVDFLSVGASTIMLFNPHIQYADLAAHGYMILDVNQNRVVGNYYYMNDMSSSGNGEYFDAAYFMNDGEYCAEEGSESFRPGPHPAFAPDYPQLNAGVEELQMVIFGAYPNPVNNEVTIQFTMKNPSDLKVVLHDAAGRLVLENTIGGIKSGINYLKIDMNSFAEGMYTLILKHSAGQVSKRIIKAN